MTLQAELGVRHAADEGLFDFVDRLVGLGPGLTPSGDDFLAGAMIAARAIGEGDVSAELWARIHSPAKRSTNAISIAYLEAAAQGWGNAALHDLLSALLRNDTLALRVSLHALDRIGHTSGWDAAAGAITTLQSWEDSQR